LNLEVVFEFRTVRNERGFPNLGVTYENDCQEQAPASAIRFPARLSGRQSVTYERLTMSVF